MIKYMLKYDEYIGFQVALLHKYCACLYTPNIIFYGTVSYGKSSWPIEQLLVSILSDLWFNMVNYTLYIKTELTKIKSIINLNKEKLFLLGSRLAFFILIRPHSASLKYGGQDTNFMMEWKGSWVSRHCMLHSGLEPTKMV